MYTRQKSIGAPTALPEFDALFRLRLRGNLSVNLAMQGSIDRARYVLGLPKPINVCLI